MGEKGGKNEAWEEEGAIAGEGPKGECWGGGELGSIVMMESNSILLHAEYSPGGLFPLHEHSRMVESFSLAQAVQRSLKLPLPFSHPICPSAAPPLSCSLPALCFSIGTLCKCNLSVSPSPPGSWLAPLLPGNKRNWQDAHLISKQRERETAKQLRWRRKCYSLTHQKGGGERTVLF